MDCPHPLPAAPSRPGSDEEVDAVVNLPVHPRPASPLPLGAAECCSAHANFGRAESPDAAISVTWAWTSRALAMHWSEL